MEVIGQAYKELCKQHLAKEIYLLLCSLATYTYYGDW